MTLAARMKNNLGPANTEAWLGSSAAIWGDCPIDSIRNGSMGGIIFEDDFVSCPSLSAGAGDTLGPYLAYGDTGVTIKAQAGVPGGVAEVAGNDADNDESVLSGGSPAFVVSDGDDARKLWGEVRVKKASIANNACALFVGLAWDHGDGVSVAKTLCLTDDDGALGAFSFLGFHVGQADGDAVDFVYKAEGQNAVVKIAGVHVPAADTWVKLGFIYDPAAENDKKIRIFVNNVEQTTYVTAADIAAATFPNAEPMAPVWAVKVGEAAESKAQLDWWRFVQRR